MSASFVLALEGYFKATLFLLEFMRLKADTQANCSADHHLNHLHSLFLQWVLIRPIAIAVAVASCIVFLFSAHVDVYGDITAAAAADVGPGAARRVAWGEGELGGGQAGWGYTWRWEPPKILDKSPTYLTKP